MVGCRLETQSCAKYRDKNQLENSSELVILPPPPPIYKAIPECQSVRRPTHRFVVGREA